MTSIIAAFARQRLADMEELQHDLGRRQGGSLKPAAPRHERPGRAPATVRLSRLLGTSAGSGAA